MTVEVEAYGMMGNASSQPCPPLDTNDSSTQTGNSSSFSKTVKGLHPSDNQDADKEDAQNLTLRREDHPRTPESLQDYAAASAQLLAESSSAPVSLVPATLQDLDAPRSGHISGSRKQGGRRRKPRSSALQPSPDAGNVQGGSRRFSLEDPLQLGKKVSQGGESENVIEDSHPPCPIDDIDENEEGLASLFQEYQTQASQLELSAAGSSGAKIDNVLSFPQDAVDPSIADKPMDKKPKGKRKRRSSSNVFDVGAEQELLDGTGQHAFDIDFDAFDKIFANEDMQLANPFIEKAGHDLPAGTEPNKETLPSSPPDDDPSLTWDGAPFQEGHRIDKQSRNLSTYRSKKRRRTEVPNSLDSQLPTNVSPYPPNAGRQDSVLPGLEDTQARSSSEVPFSQPRGPLGGAKDTPADIASLQSPPPRLENPSNSRGNKKQRGGKKGKDHNPSLRELSEKGGMFSNKEIERLDSFRDRYCEENNESHWRFNELIHSNIRGSPEAARLFNAIHEEISYRTRQSVLRFCRRHFHNFASRGAWTEEDDIALRDAVAKKGTSWKAVGAMIDRFPEDCRDRYRNYIVNAQKRNTDSWTPAETRALVKAVDFCMRLLRDQRLQAREDRYEGHEVPASASESDQEVQDLKLINWQVVSDRMGGTRSRLQCSTKWNYMKDADRREYLQEIRLLEKENGSRSKTGGRKSGSWRLRRSRRKVRNMKTGDKYDILQALADCDAVTESKIPWISLGTEEFRERWSPMDLKAALEVFRGEIRGSEGMSYQEVVNRVYTRLMADNPGDFEDRWDPAVDGDLNTTKKKGTRREQNEQNRAIRYGTGKERMQAEEARRLRLERQRSKRQSGPKLKIKSKLFIDSDDEEEVVGEDCHNDRRRSKTQDENEDEEERVSQRVTDSVDGESPDHTTPERAVSEQENQRERLSREHTDATMEDDEDMSVDDSPCPRNMRPSPPHAETDGISSDDSEDSLFNSNDGIDNTLVDQLQLLRNA